MARYRILIVDDEPAILSLLEAAFESRPWLVDTESSPTKAFALHRKQRYDLILTDKNMPVLDGIELARRIRRTDSRVRIVIMTGFGSLDSAMQSGNLSVDAYIEKPFDDVYAVADVVESALQGKEPAPATRRYAVS